MPTLNGCDLHESYVAGCSLCGHNWRGTDVAIIAELRAENERLRAGTLFVPDPGYVAMKARAVAAEADLLAAREALKKAEEAAEWLTPYEWTILERMKAAESALAAKEERVATLEKIIEEAPHLDTCGSVLNDNPSFYPCSCFKSKAALARVRE